MLSSEDRIARARIMLERKAVVASQFLSADIRGSWERCRTMGLDPLARPRAQAIEHDCLKDHQEAKGRLMHIVHSEIQNLHAQISGSNFAIVFASDKGVVLHRVTDDSFADTADISQIRPGRVWREEVMGTNALGAVVISGQPAVVHAGEHYFRHYSNLTCVAVPVRSPDGSIAGIIDASSNCRSRQQHTLALLQMSGRTIENALLHDAYRDELIIEFHSRREFLGTLQAGLLAFSDAGRLRAANSQARALLYGLPLHPGVHFDQLFRVGFTVLRDVRKPHFRTSLTDILGSTYAISAHNPAAEISISSCRLPPLEHRDGAKGLGAMVCDDDAVRKVAQQAALAARRSVPILIQGETGTGKEMLARFAHEASGRKGRFVAVNCASLTETLAESTLFGYRAGAFTGADATGATGLIRQADGGTLFLDEIGDMPVHLQSVLLRFLDDWQVRPVGSTEETSVDILLVSATNRDLDSFVSGGSFRSDLFYRLKVMDVHLPPLRERTDLPQLIEALAGQSGENLAFSGEAMDILRDCIWPGNIRQLRNMLMRLALEHNERPIQADKIAGLLGADKSRSASGNHLNDKKKTIILRCCQRNNGNISAVARELGISRNTVYKALRAAKETASSDLDHHRPSPRPDQH